MNLLRYYLFFIPIFEHCVYLNWSSWIISPTILKYDFVSFILSSIVILLNLKGLACNHSYLFRLLNPWDLLFRQRRILFKNGFNILQFLFFDCFHSLRSQILGYLFVLFLGSHGQLLLESLHFSFLIGPLSLFLFSVLFFLVTLPLEQVIFLLLEVTSKLFLNSLFIFFSLFLSRMLFFLLFTHLFDCAFFYLCLVCNAKFTFT